MFAPEKLENEIVKRWLAFAERLSPGATVAFVYHADLDGVVGAAYASAALLAKDPTIRCLPYWVTTEDYNFEDLKVWLGEVQPEYAVFTDISIETHKEVLAAVSSLIRKELFIFDDHVVKSSNLSFPRNVILVNPLLFESSFGWDHPVPAFVFAYLLSVKIDHEMPEWLQILCIFVEGVDEFFSEKAASLLKKNPDIGATSLRDAFRKTSISKISSLIKAEFVGAEQTHNVFHALIEVANHRITSAESFSGRLMPELGPKAQKLRVLTTRTINYIERLLLREKSLESKIYFLPFSLPHSVIGPACSVLRGKYDRHAFIGRSVGKRYATYELRLSNQSTIDLTSILESISRNVCLISHGGHPSGAGALVEVKSMDKFEHLLKQQFGNLGFIWETLDEPEALLNSDSH